MKELTKAEEQVMQILWELEKGFIRDILERMPDPTPAYTTVSTIVRILETKGVCRSSFIWEDPRIFSSGKQGRIPQVYHRWIAS